jgi:hypothetical protein
METVNVDIALILGVWHASSHAIFSRRAIDLVKVLSDTDGQV